MNDRSVCIRAMVKKDVFAVATLYRELVIHVQSVTRDPYIDGASATHEAISQLVSDALIDPKQHIIVADDDDGVVGFFAGEIMPCAYLPFSKIERVGYIAGAYLMPAYRKKGLSRQMESELMNFFKENNISYVDVSCMTQNVEGLCAWQALGYRPYRERLRKPLG